MSIPFVFVLFWFWISHVDRLHLRESSKILGSKINCTKFVKEYLLSQINAISESIAGVTDGMTEKNSIIRVANFKSIDVQTDPLEPEVVIKEIEVVKEIVKEIPVEIIKEIYVEVIKEVPMINSGEAIYDMFDISNNIKNNIRNNKKRRIILKRKVKN